MMITGLGRGRGGGSERFKNIHLAVLGCVVQTSLPLDICRKKSDRERVRERVRES